VEVEGTSDSETKSGVTTVAVEMPGEHRLTIEWDKYTREILNSIENTRLEMNHTPTEIKDNSMKSKPSACFFLET